MKAGARKDRKSGSLMLEKNLEYSTGKISYLETGDRSISGNVGLCWERSTLNGLSKSQVTMA